MKIKAIKTHAITTRDKSILKVLDKYVKNLSERSIVVVTSKIVSITEGSVVDKREKTREDLVPEHCQLYIPRKYNKWGFCFSLTRNILIASAGIDESNADDKLILWPKDAQKSANMIRKYLLDRFKIKWVGVLIVDSHTTPFRRGVSGIGLSHSGFKALKDYIGQSDLFDRPYKFTNQSIIDGLAASASLIMGEGNECTPLVVAEDLPFVEFQGRNPNKKELNMLKISREEDLYWPILKNAPWKKGKK